MKALIVAAEGLGIGDQEPTTTKERDQDEDGLYDPDAIAPLLGKVEPLAEEAIGGTAADLVRGATELRKLFGQVKFLRQWDSEKLDSWPAIFGSTWQRVHQGGPLPIPPSG